MKKIITLVLIAVFLVLCGVAYSFLHKAKENKLASLYIAKPIESNRPTNISNTEKIKDTYVYQTEDLLLYLDVSNAKNGQFDGNLQLIYIEDLYKNIALQKLEWQVKGIHKKDNTWTLTLYQNSIDSYKSTATISDSAIKIIKLPALNNPTYTLKNKPSFQYKDTIGELNNLYNQKTKERKQPTFENVKGEELPKKLERTLKSFPVHSNESKLVKGNTYIYIHMDYLKELSSRIESNLNNIDKQIEKLEKYFKHNDSLSDPYFKDTSKKSFDIIDNLSTENASLFGYYEKVLSFYDLPNQEKEDNYDLKNKETNKMIDNLVKTYSRKTIKDYNNKDSLITKKSNELYKIYNKKLKNVDVK